MREVETQTLRLYQGTSLIHMLAECFFKCFMQQVSCRMIFHNISTKLTTHLGCHLSIYTQFTRSNSNMVYMLSMRRLEQAFHIGNSRIAANNALVTNLTAAFRIERSFLQNHLTALSFGQCVHKLVIRYNGYNFCIDF
ncbi:hypothetical protein D3C73_880370 [compost metagenome]